MKRSEMVKIMFDIMKDNHFGQYGEFYQMVDSVLEAIEDNGMLPPSYLPELEYHESTGKQLEVEVLNEWEQE